MSVKVVFNRLVLLALALSLFGIGQNWLQRRDASGNGGGYSGIGPNLQPLVGKTYVRRIKGSACTSWESEIRIESPQSILYRENVCAQDSAVEIPPEALKFNSYDPDFLILSNYKIFQYRTEGAANPPPYTESLCIGAYSDQTNPDSPLDLGYDVAIQQLADGSYQAMIYGGIINYTDGGYVILDAFSEAVTSRTVTENQIIYQTANLRITVDRTSSQNGVPKYVSQVQGRLFYNTEFTSIASCILQNIE